MAWMDYCWGILRWCVVALGFAVATNLSASEPEMSRQWGQWRGPLATGVAPHGDPPVEWSETKNLRWTARLPGSGHSSPIVWGDLVFITAVVPQGE